MLLSRQNELGLGGVHGLNHGSGGKNSAYNEGDPSSIPGLGRTPGDGLMAHTIKNLPAMRET